jgi:hypothetical protein
VRVSKDKLDALERRRDELDFERQSQFKMPIGIHNPLPPPMARKLTCIISATSALRYID